ncbi:MAG: tRNA (guanosine(37)-N1)-methyltransferase TrmD, partial [Minisyncoccia bacterium]
EMVSVQCWNPRDFTTDKHQTVDDTSYGGGPGMVMMAEPILDLWSHITKKTLSEKLPLTKKRTFKTILLSPGGKKFTTHYAKSAASEYTDIIFICGRYEGIDSRVQQVTAAELVSIGDYVLTGGEVAAMVMVDSISRQIDGVLGNKQSLEESRISSHEMYTRPAELKYKGKTYGVPDVLLSGNHKKIDEWRKEH